MTTIVELRADKVRVPFRRPFLTAAGLWGEREGWIVQVIDDAGRTGLGEAVLEPLDGETAATVLDQLVREAAVRAVQKGLPTADELDRHGAPGRALRAALDGARLDLAARPAAITGRDGPGVAVNASVPSVGPRESAEAALQALEAGFRTLKLKAGAERETDALVERLRAVRAAVGPEVRLRLDVNGAWDVETAVERLTAIRRLEIEYVEQPIPPGDPVALAAVRRRGRVPVAADEAVTSLRSARELLEADAVDVLVVKLARVGGPVVAAEVAELAAGRGVPVVISTLFETGIGIAAGLATAAELPALPGPLGLRPPDHGLATAGLLEHDLVRLPLLIEGGRMWRPEPDDSPVGGLGVTVDERALARHRIESVVVEA